MWLERLFTRWFTAYGRRLVLNRWLRYAALLLPVLLTVALGVACRRLQHRPGADPLRDFTPADAPSWTEAAIIEQHWPFQDDEFVVGRTFNFNRYLQVVITSRQRCPGEGLADDCNLLDPLYWSAIMRLEQRLAEEVVVTDAASNVTYAYDNASNQSHSLCLSFWSVCHRIARDDGPLSILQHKQLYEQRGVKVGFPIVKPKQGSSVYLGFNLGGVGLDGNGSIEFVASLRFMYYLQSQNAFYDRLSEAWEIAVDRWMQDVWPTTDEHDVLEVSFTHSRSITRGLQQTTANLVPRFSVTFALLAMFCLLNMIETKRSADPTGGCCSFSIDTAKSKPWLAAAGLLTALFGIVSGIGSLLWLGFGFHDTVAIVPFLVISVGVDDMFILVAGWHGTDSGQSVENRMAHALGDAAVAISITSITSAASFAVGTLTTIPAVRLFCLYAAVCILFNYVYQVTFFAFWMVFFGEREHAAYARQKKTESGQTGSQTGHSATAAVQPIKDGLYDKADGKHDWHEMTAHQIGKQCTLQLKADRVHQREKERGVIECFLHDVYGPWLLRPASKAAVGLVYLVYLAGALYGLANMQEGLEFNKLLLEDDPTVAHIQRQDFYMRQGLQVEIVFNRPGDLSDERTRRKINSIVREYESGSGLTLGPAATQFWMRTYLEYMNEIRGIPTRNTADFWVTKVRQWSSVYTYYKNWGKDIAWNYTANNTTVPSGSGTCDASSCMEAFRLRVALQEANSADSVLRAAVAFRGIAARHPEFNITTFHQFRQLADQLLQVLPNTVQNVWIAIVCMAVVSLLFIPNPICTVWITLALVSIDLGVAGYLFVWSVHMDQISMINIIMSIGFAIDCTAHIIYGYVNAPASLTPDQRCIDSMQKLAWPVFQGGVSTILGVSVLTLVDSYMMRAFFKCVCLVIVFGVTHALVFLPVLLSSCMPLLDRVWHRASCCRPDNGKLSRSSSDSDAAA